MSVFLTFGGGKKNFHEAAKRLEKQAHATGIFDKVYCYLDEDLKTMNDFWSIHGSFVEKNPRLYGYAIWKPYLILKTLETMKDGERLFYADAGCEFDLDCENPKENYEKLVNYYKNQLVHASYCNLEKSMTKMDLIVQLSMKDHPEINTSQIQTTAFILTKCDKILEFVRLWYALCGNYHLINDMPSTIPNAPKYDEHRHEQSIFSILLKKMNFFQYFKGTERNPKNNVESVICLNRNRSGVPFPACRVTGSPFYNFNDGDAFICGKQVIHMSNLIRSIEPEYIVETGFASGRTSATMVQSCRTKSIQNYVVCDNDYLKSPFQNYFAVMCPYINFCTGSTDEILTPDFLKEQFPKKIDWVTIDGADTYKGIVHELTVVMPFVRSGGIIYVVGDQLTRPFIKDACNEFKKIYDSKIIVEEEYINRKLIEFYRVR